MRRVISRIERLEKAHRVSQTVAPNITVVFIDVDGVVRSELHFVDGKREWTRYDEGDSAK